MTSQAEGISRECNVCRGKEDIQERENTEVRPLGVSGVELQFRDTIGGSEDKTTMDACSAQHHVVQRGDYTLISS
jgi:hypothetical protein